MISNINHKITTIKTWNLNKTMKLNLQTFSKNYIYWIVDSTISLFFYCTKGELNRIIWWVCNCIIQTVNLSVFNVQCSIGLRSWIVSFAFFFVLKFWRRFGYPSGDNQIVKRAFVVNDFFLPFSNVCSASDGSQCRHSSPKRRKLFPCPSSWPSTGKTNWDENVLPSKSVIFRRTSIRCVSIFRLIECANASLK